MPIDRERRRCLLYPRRRRTNGCKDAHVFFDPDEEDELDDAPDPAPFGHAANEFTTSESIALLHAYQRFLERFPGQPLDWIKIQKAVVAEGGKIGRYKTRPEIRAEWRWLYGA